MRPGQLVDVPIYNEDPAHRYRKIVSVMTARVLRTESNGMIRVRFLDNLEAAYFSDQLRPYGSVEPLVKPKRKRF